MENEYLLDYIGKTKNNKLKNDLTKFVSDLNNRKSYCMPMSLIDITNPNDNEILQIGASVSNDLITNGFGNLMNGFLGLTDTICVDVNGVNKTMVKGVGVNNYLCSRNADNPPSNPVNAIGTEFRLGSSGVAPQRTDIAINALLPNTPESDYQNTNNSVFNSGLGTVTMSRSYPASGGAGTIRELGLFYTFSLNISASKIMITHDLVSPNVNYVIGQNINVELVYQI